MNQVDDGGPGKTVLITGSSSGIGLAIAGAFAGAGYHVGLNSFESPDRVGKALERVKQATARAGGKGEVAYFQADLSRVEGERLVADFIGRFGRIDVLINNAGVQKVMAADELPVEDWQRIRAIILDAAFETIRAALPPMKKQGGGRIINIASAHGLVASPFKSAYIAAKHGVVGLTKSVALEVAEENITVNAICPGYVWTDLVKRQVADQARVHGVSEQEVREKIMLGPQPTKRFIDEEEVAGLALYLAGDLARSITGTSIAIDGGWTAR